MHCQSHSNITKFYCVVDVPTYIGHHTSQFYCILSVSYLTYITHWTPHFTILQNLKFKLSNLHRTPHFTILLYLKCNFILLTLDTTLHNSTVSSVFYCIFPWTPHFTILLYLQYSTAFFLGHHTSQFYCIVSVSYPAYIGHHTSSV